MRTLLRFIQKYSDLLLFLFLEIIAITLIVQNSQYQRAKLVSLNREVSGYLYSKVDGAREYLSLREVNQRLADENLKLRNRLDLISSSLDTALVTTELRGQHHYFFVPSRVVHNSIYDQYNFLTLDKGKKQGVFRDMGVISDGGLVGIVLESSANFATVIPIINRDFKLSAKIKSSNYAGILQWDGNSPLFAVLTEIPFHAKLAVGDTILTSGFSSIFPEGIELGIIESYSLDKGNFYDIRVSLFTDFQRLYHVNVIRNYRQEEQLNLENQYR
ncbi:MAG: rod shape-determining protein MreC [Bacteroidia bacterium]|jgi:rod shape-determining protein MreC|nr:MAG: rod shape-determining protein MreC [Bacteroidia bacterium]